MTTITFHTKSRKKQVKDFGKVLSDYFNYCDLFIHNEDEDGNILPDNDWVLSTCSGTPILEGRDAIESDSGILDVDGDYDTIIVKNMEDLYEEEIEILRDYYLNGGYTDCYCIDDILQVLGYNEISSIKVYKSNAEVFHTNGCIHIERDNVSDMDEDEMTDYIREIFEENNISPLHMGKIEDVVTPWCD